MTTGELTTDDIEVLVEALAAWEVKDMAGEIMVSLLGAVFTRNNPADKALHDSMMADEKAKYEQERRVRKDRSTLLQAKLIGLKTALTVGDAERLTRPQ